MINIRSSNRHAIGFSKASSKILRGLVLLAICCLASFGTHAKCFQEGGLEVCVAREKQKPTFALRPCFIPWDNSCPINKSLCRARGGTPTDDCYNLRCEGSPVALDDSSIPLVGRRYSELHHGACKIQDSSDSGWGFSGECTSSAWTPQYDSGGAEISSPRKLVFTGTSSDCQTQLTVNLMAQRRTSYLCPQGTVQVQVGNQLLCSRDLSGVCPVNNPTEPALGEKLHTDIDYAAATGGLSLSRSYSSYGRWQPTTAVRATATSSLGGNWRTNFDKSVHVLDGEFKRYVVMRPSGTPEIFDSNGMPVHHLGRATAKLQIVTSAGGDIEGWRYRAADGTEEIFDASGKLIKVSYRNGDELSLEYSPAGFLQVVRDRQHRAMHFQYSAEGLLLRAELPDGDWRRFEFDDRENLTRVEHGSAGTARTYRYEDQRYPHALTHVVDEHGVTYASYAYDSSGRVSQSVTAPGILGGVVNRKSYTYPSPGHSRIVDERGMVQDMQAALVRGVWRLTGTSQPCTSCGSQGAKLRSYDTAGFLDIATDFSGTQTDHDYNERGLEVRRIESANKPATKRTIETDWHAQFNQPIERRTRDHNSVLVAKETWSYNGRGQVTARSQIDVATSDSRTTSYAYCETVTAECPLLGLLKSIDGPRADVADITQYAYYSVDHPSCASAPTSCLYRKGDLRAVTNASGHRSETLAYDGAGRPLAVMDANGTVSEMSYHPRGWLQQRIVRGPDDSRSDDDAITAISYYQTGLVQRVTQPDGDFTAYEYDQAHRLAAISDTVGNRIEYTLDAAGNRIGETVSDPEGQLKRRLSRSFDTLNRLVHLRDAAGSALSTNTYGVDGQLDTVTDANGQISDQDHDPLGRLIKQISNVHGAGADRAETEFGYDGLDRLREVTDPKGLTTRYRYDGLGDLTELDSPDTGVTRYTYDSAGNRASQTDARGVTLSMSYDALGRLTHQRSVGAPDIVYSYDTGPFGKGRLTELSDGTTTNRWRYDRFGRVSEKDQVIRGRTYTVRYEYSAGGRLERITYPSGKVVDYGRDANGNIERIVAGGAILLDQVRYEPFGPVSGWVWGNGETHQRTYDLDGRLTSMTVPLEAPQLHVFGYDGQYRLNSASLDDVQLDWTYDATGNRLSETRDGAASSYQYSPDSHRLQGVSGAETRQFGYNAAGAIASDTGAALTYDYRNRLVAGNGATYAINALGQRVEKSGAGANTPSGARVFVYDEGGQLLGEYDAGTGAALAEHVYLDTLPIGLLRPEGNYQVTPDHLGAPRSIVRPADGSVVWSWNREPFGSGLASAHSGIDYAPRFPGQYYDQESGLHYNYFRSYNPATGRYTASDPIGLEGGVSTYLYAGANPLSWVDRSGLAMHRPDSQYCQDLRKKIENIRKDIEKRYDELDADSDGLPERIGAPEAFHATRRGHRTLINILDQRARRLEDKYDDECGGDDCESCPTGGQVVVAVGAIGAGYIAYRCIRMIPSIIIPPLWPTIPANAVVP